MLEAGRHLRSRGETAPGRASRPELGVQDLEGDRAVVFRIVRQKHRGHAAAAQLALQRVTPAKGCLELLL